MKLVYTDRSKEDLEIAFTWYESQRSGLGFDFLDCIEVALLSILEYPEKHPNAYEKFRRCVIRRFPFSVFYTIEKIKLLYILYLLIVRIRKNFQYLLMYKKASFKFDLRSVR